MPAFTTTLLRRPDDPLGWSARLLVPADVVEGLGESIGQRFVCSVVGLAPWHCALTSDGRGGRYVIFNKTRLAKLERAGVDLESLRVTLRLDDSPYGAPMPEELGELLAQDPLLNTYFTSLPRQAAQPHLPRGQVQDGRHAAAQGRGRGRVPGAGAGGVGL